MKKILLRADQDNGLMFFGETAPYLEEVMGERDTAHQYLNLWKHFLIRKFALELADYELVDEQWIDRAPVFAGPVSMQWTLALKLCFKKKLPYQLG